MRIEKGTLEVDLHGMNRYQAGIRLNAALRQAGGGTYRLRVIHGFHGGTELRDFVRTEYAGHPKVLRVEKGTNEGETVFVLRELH